MTVKLAADENFNNDIVRGLVRRVPTLDIVRVQDAGLSGLDDTAVLAWAASEARVLLTHDVSTMTRFAYERVARGEPMPGVWVFDVTGCHGREAQHTHRPRRRSRRGQDLVA